TDRRAWFVTINGTRIDLGRDKKAAFETFHRLIAEPRRLAAPSGALVALIDLFLDWCQKHRAPDTYEWYRYRLQRFAEAQPTLAVRDLRPYHVQQWLDGLEGLSSGSKRNYCRAIKRALSWALRQGLIDANPIAHLEQPRAGKRERVVSQAEFDAMLRLCGDA